MEPVNSTPQGRDRKFTDAQLRECIRKGMSQKAIAEKFSATPSAVSKRVRQLNLQTAVTVVAPQESQRFVSRTVDAMGELTNSLRRVNKLQDACDEWLTDAEDPGKYDLGPRADEVTVTYLVPGEKGWKKEKALLSELLARAHVGLVEEVSSKHADPRELILKTCSEVRQVVSTCADLARLLADVRQMQLLREVLLTEIQRSDPDAANRIRAALQHALEINGVLDAPPDVRWEIVN